MRVAYVCTDPGIPVFGTKGASVHVQEVIRVLRARGAEVHLFCARTGGQAPDDLTDLPVHVLPTARSKDVARRERDLLAADAVTAAAVAEHGPFDLVYQRYSLWSSAVMTLAAERGWRSILEVNAPLVDEQARHRGLVHRAEAESVIATAATAADAVVCVSEPVAGWVRGHAPHARTVVVPNGVDVERIRPRHGGPVGGPFTIGFVGTLKPWHGVDVLLDAFAELLGRGVSARLLLVGDGPMAADVDARARALGVAQAVVRTGAVDPAEVPCWLHTMDTAVAPYPATADTYFSPLKIYEYLAAGLPIVASAVGQIPGTLTDGHDGRLVPAGDATALADVLQELAANPPARAALGAAARRSAVERHSWARVVTTSLAAAGVPADGLAGRPAAVMSP